MNSELFLDFGRDFNGLVALVLVAAIRPGVAFLVLPATTDPMMTPTIRHLLTVVIGTYAAIGMPAAGFLDGVTPAFIAQLLFREAAIGFSLGFAAGKGFWIAQSVGALIDNLAGYNNVQLINPSSPEQNTPVADILLQLFVTMFWVAGGMLAFLQVLFQTYAVWPVTAASGAPLLWPADGAGAYTAALMNSVVSVAMPILFILGFIDVGLGLVSRAAKNVDTSALGQPLKGAAALVALVLFSSVFMSDVKGYLGLNELSEWFERLKLLR